MNPTTEVRKPVVEIPKDGLAGLKQNWKSDLVSGFILFLIALPLSLGIAMASGAPPMAGIISAIIGGMLVSQINGSFVTINGPAAGLIVVILASVERLGGGSEGYHCTLAAIVVSGIILFLMGKFRAGALGKFFPATVVHGMLAAIGIIIILKQLPFMLGVKAPAKEPLEILVRTPEMFAHLNPEIALIGFVSMAILIVHSLIQNSHIKRIPAPIVVVAFSVIAGAFFGFSQSHTYDFMGHTYSIDPKTMLVRLPANPMEGFAFPDFCKIADGAFWMSVLAITLVQGIETLLSCAAVDRLDAFGRHADLSKDLAGVGAGSAISGAVGGLPMIAEIVRSTANVTNGARTRWSNFFHGSFILAFVLLAAGLINMIPLASLAALLVFTGYRLASPKVFRSTQAIGTEQTILFVTTIIATLATDLLVGVSIGIATKFLLHLFHGAPVNRLFKANVRITEEPEKTVVQIKDAAIFSNYLSLQKALDSLPKNKPIVCDLSRTALVDHSSMDHLFHYSKDLEKIGCTFEIVGLDFHKADSKHPLSARRLQVAKKASHA